METIKVVCRFKGREALSHEEQQMWPSTRLEITAPAFDGKPDSKFTFDSILDGSASQEQMYA